MKFFSVPAQEVSQESVVLRDPIFISDLHLSRHVPDTIRGFMRFLDEVASKHQELVILGDLFDYWVGDDAIDTMQDIVDALKHFSKDHKLYILHGNRDFMMGEDFSKATGATILADPAVTSNQGFRMVLSHGDAWCTDDSEYQKVRQKLRSFWWQWTMLRLPLKKRLEIAENGRAKSQIQKQKNDAAKMDVVNAEVLKSALKEYAEVVIHGHTHLPGRVALDKEHFRLALPDWHFEGDQCVRGGYVEIIDNHPVLKTFE